MPLRVGSAPRRRPTVTRTGRIRRWCPSTFTSRISAPSRRRRRLRRVLARGLRRQVVATQRCSGAPLRSRCRSRRATRGGAGLHRAVRTAVAIRARTKPEVRSAGPSRARFFIPRRLVRLARRPRQRTALLLTIRGTVLAHQGPRHRLRVPAPPARRLVALTETSPATRRIFQGLRIPEDLRAPGVSGDSRGRVRAPVLVGAEAPVVGRVARGRGQELAVALAVLAIRRRRPGRRRAIVRLAIRTP